jgi:hypothetical protein
MIKGTPAYVSRVRDFLKQADDQARQAQRATASSVHRQMVELARTTHAWHGLEDGIQMQEQEDGSFVYGFDPAHAEAQRATELEFGTSDASPVSVFRKVLAGRRDGIERNLRAELRGWGT